MVASVVGELVQKGIQAARAGNRLLARLHLEKATETDSTNPELWLSWVAESPAKSQVYRRKLIEFPEYAASAAAGLEWCGALTGEGATSAKTSHTSEMAARDTVEMPVAAKVSTSPRVPNALLNRAFPSLAPTAAPASAMEDDEFPVSCPACDVLLLARHTALGQTRACPACQHHFVMIPKISAPVIVGCSSGCLVDRDGADRGR